MAPADGDYIVRVSDARGYGGPRYAYRLLLRMPTPNFDVFADTNFVNIAPGSRLLIDVRVLRKDGFDGQVKLRVQGLPEGFTAETESVLPDDDLVRIALVAGPGAKSTPLGSRFRITAESEVDGKSFVHETSFGAITVSEKQPDVTVNDNDRELQLEPGKIGSIGVRLTRANGFDSRSPISVLNLPFGVRVMYTGLNGILVCEGETDRRIEIIAEPWVKPITRTIYILAMIETQTVQEPVFLGAPIQLRIAGGEKLAKQN